MKASTQRHLKKGFNLVEAAIVLGVVGLVIGGIWLAAATVRQNLQATSASKGLVQIVQNVRRLFSGQNLAAAIYGSTLTPILIAANAMPADFVKNSTTAVNPWNGTVYVGIDQVTLDKISVYYYQVPKEACIKISTQNTNMAAGLGLISIEVNGIYSGGSLDSVTTFPYSIHQATLACGTDNNITWVFSLK